MSNQEQTSAGDCAVECDVAAHAQVCVPVTAVADLRGECVSAVASATRAQPHPANLLKHIDEQTVGGIAAVVDAIRNHNLGDVDFTRWAVLGAPRFPGRPIMVPCMKRFFAEGAWGVSPHMIPHRSLHSLSGTISQVFKINGINFGVGCGNSGADEVLFAALALLERSRPPGAWVVVTAQDPECAYDADGNGPPDKRVRALALALTPARPGWRGLRMRLEMDAVGYDSDRATSTPVDYFRLFAMLEQLGERVPSKSVTCSLQGRARLTLQWAQEMAGVTAHGRHPHPAAAHFAAARDALPRTSAEMRR
jgi:hypothetical protein